MLPAPGVLEIILSGSGTTLVFSLPLSSVSRSPRWRSFAENPISLTSLAVSGLGSSSFRQYLVIADGRVDSEGL